MYEFRSRSERIISVICRKRESGVIAILTVILLVVLLGCIALALDLARLYNRRVELENVAASTALVAAASLNGTRKGVESAIQGASDRLTLPPPLGLTYAYGTRMKTWSDEAIMFSATPGSGWVPASSAKENPDGMIFAKVDTGQLNPAYGEVTSMLIHVLSHDRATSPIKGSAVAGRSAISVLPLAICAMQPEKAKDRSGELVEFGFRRGVSYDLMQLNMDPGATTGQTFLINPGLSQGAIDIETTKPFICSGSMLTGRIENAPISVESPFPLSSLYPQLNSRFDSYTAPCNEYTAPPDENVRAYVRTPAGMPWMSTLPMGQSARASSEGGRRWTVAGPDPSPDGTTAADYGPLWSYAKAARFSPTEPPDGYITYDPDDWKNLYTPGKPKATTDRKTKLPYERIRTNPPSGRIGVADRRVLNVPLLSCPVSGNRATVLGIGRFFMTVPATSTTLHTEFAGLVSDQKLGLSVELHK